MVKEGKTRARAMLIQAAMEEAGLQNPVSIVAVIRGLTAIIAAIQAFDEIRKILQKEKGG